MRHINRKILLIIFVCLFIGGLSIGKMAINNSNKMELNEPKRKSNMLTTDQGTPISSAFTENQATANPSPEEGSLCISWVSNAQSAIREFVVGAEIELEISCNKNAQINWSVSKGELLGNLTSNKVWWRLPDNQGEYTVTVTVQDGQESMSLSRTVKVNLFTTSWDAFTDITVLNGGVAPIVSYDSKTGIPSMIIGRYSSKKIYTAEDAIDSLNDIKVIMDIENPREEFKLSRTQNRNNITSYYMQQKYKDIPVYGGHIVVIVNSNSDVQSLNGRYYPQVRSSGISIEPAIDKSKASDIAEEDLAKTDTCNFIYRLIAPRKYKLRSAILVIDMVHFENPELVWELSADAYPEIWDYYIHAQTGKIIDKYSTGTFGN